MGNLVKSGNLGLTGSMGYQKWNPEDWMFAELCFIIEVGELGIGPGGEFSLLTRRLSR